MPKFNEIPAGGFLMGSDPKKDHDAYSDEFPQRKIHLDRYWMAETATTVAEYMEYLKDTKSEEKPKFDTSNPNHPVSHLTWGQAKKYCEWYSDKIQAEAKKAVMDIEKFGQKVPELIRLLAEGKAHAHLPTEEQWEKAARGPDGLIYPWGNEYKENACNDFNSEHDGLCDVDLYREYASPYGILNMSGNVLEWCEDEYAPYPGADDDEG